MVDGYEYLQGLSTQLPEMFRETAEQHRKTLQGAISSLSSDELAVIKENEEVPTCSALPFTLSVMRQKRTSVFYTYFTTVLPAYYFYSRNLPVSNWRCRA